MTSIIFDLINFVSTGTLSETLSETECQIGTSRLRVVSIKILGWLDGASRLNILYPYKLNPNHDWCKELQIVLAHNKELGDLFEVSEWKLQFNSKITSDKKNEILKIVDENYNPELRRDKK